MQLLFCKMMKCWRYTLQLKNCAKIVNSKKSTINQMSYIQKFFEQHLPLFYLEELRQRISQPQFLQLTNQHNIFDLTLDLILTPKSCLQSSSQTQAIPQLASLCKVSYQQLQNVRLPVKQEDSEIVKILKSSLKYVHMQMMQILIRLVLCFYQSMNANAINETLSATIEEISWIYPALKIQISYSHQDINLCEFFDRCLSKITKFMPLNEVSKAILEKIAQKCEFIGPLEKLFKKYTQSNLHQLPSKEMKPTIIKNGPQLIEEKSKTQMVSNVSHHQNPKSQRMSSICSQKQEKFDDVQLFRSRKRKLIIKERLKSTEGGSKTPYRQNETSYLNTPSTVKKQQLMVRSDTTQNNASSILYRRLLSKKAFPTTERTLYFGSTHKFVPKKALNSDPQLYIQSFTASSSLTNECSNPFEEAVKKTQRKVSNFIKESSVDKERFYIPETPKQKHLSTQRSSSTQFKIQMNLFKL